DLAPPWPRRQLRELLLEHTGVTYDSDQAALMEVARSAGIATAPDWTKAKLVDEIKTNLVDPKLIQPCFIVDYPVETTPLAKRRSPDSPVVERFEAFAGGMEIGDAFT